MAFLLFSCIQNKASQEGNNKASNDSLASTKKSNEPVIDTINDEIGSVISGINPLRDCIDLSSEKKWRAYQQHINDDWKLVEKNKTGPIERWRRKNLDTAICQALTLFYPFAGADFLYAHAFFPDASNYLLIGLESIGRLHNCNTMAKKDFLDYLEEIRSSLYYSNLLGFFRTESMETDLTQQSLDGTLPLILFYIRKTGHRLSGITYFTLDNKGTIIPCRQDKTTIGVKVALL